MHSIFLITVLFYKIEAPCFKPPNILKAHEIQEICDLGHLDMTWSFGESGKSHFRFVSDIDEVYLEIFFAEDATSMLSEETQLLFQKSSAKSLENFSYFTFVLSRSGETSFNVPLRSQIYDSSENSSYLVHERRELDEEPNRVENDFLKQILFTGIQPYRINANEVRAECGEEEARAFDWIVCIGLSHDDRGFLAWYKEMNPDGKILSIDINKPSYLGPEDYILNADLQEVLLAL